MVYSTATGTGRATTKRAWNRKMPHLLKVSHQQHCGQERNQKQQVLRRSGSGSGAKGR